MTINYLDYQTATISDILKFNGEMIKRLGKVNKMHKIKVDQAWSSLLMNADTPISF
ncbi:MAG: hypothetical protein ACSLEM_05815 [Candidatus Malihini olakiniferum]